ncbi:MAG TPA: MBL fold metallo-hydrolase [Xanthobacteraceae bacterium]|jgi:hypothetical protein|nr:MAG: hypothetical protein B7Y61_17630 [Rhizobiales bacterium 35-66-30]OZA97073.1 MAG: hypothetical protein B7X67_23380 [Rhizobiales bacterium 39-66-18]HQS07894.1 MBL fold metallo-hydrolase [Xanthobacteraceae bacterium]HQS49347.1 MBL fold metallo-hydrolase [Xanthobacteraceae bacterium]
MNPFFEERGEGRMPAALHARTIDFSAGRAGPAYVLFDAVDADWFDGQLAERGGSISQEVWGELIEYAPIYAVEICADQQDNGAAALWLKGQGERPDDWVHLTIRVDPDGPADLYDTIDGPPQRVSLALAPMRPGTQQALSRATALTASSDTDVKGALPVAVLDRIVVLDVGQGSANAVYNDAGEVIAYVDLGAGILKNSKTWPAGLMTDFCRCHQPVVILTHWHYDHFNGANKIKAARALTWIAPLQTIGPGPQSAMANAIRRAGQLLVWGGGAFPLSAGGLTLESCTGPAGDFDRTGIAVWATGGSPADPILMPGDAHYPDIPGISSGRGVSALVVSHHGGDIGGSTPPAPGKHLAFSYGDSNTYGHPAASPVGDLKAVGWSIGLHPAGPRRHERVTCDLRASTGLGSILLNWPTPSTPPRSCGASACAATVDHCQ